jgi:hypothetical protein
MARSVDKPWHDFWGHLSRRQLLQVGGLGMLGLALPEFLRARAPSPSPGTRLGPEKSCIFIVQYGGASHIDTWDPKPDAPEDIRGPYKPIATSVPGLRMAELLPRLARLAKRCCLVRSMSHGNGEHDGGMHVCLTGHSRPQETTPCFGSVVARLRPARATLPSYTGQFGLGLVLPRFDQALSALLGDLDERGLLGQTLAVVVGEFGRSPKIAVNPYPGRDHRPACYSALLAGAGVRGGLVYGASDRTGAHVKDRPVCPEEFSATLFHALGVAPDTRSSPDGATRPASTGQPILDLFA